MFCSLRHLVSQCSELRCNLSYSKRIMKKNADPHGFKLSLYIISCGSRVSVPQSRTQTALHRGCYMEAKQGHTLPDDPFI